MAQTDAQEEGFVADIVGKIGVPVMSATVVGCLLTRTFELMHVALFAVGLFIEFIAWRMKR